MVGLGASLASELIILVGVTLLFVVVPVLGLKLACFRNR